MLLAYSGEKTFAPNVLKLFPGLQPLFDCETVFGFDFSSKDLINILLIILACVLIVYLFSIIVLNILAIRGMRHLKSIVTLKVYRLQKTLYFCVLSQSIFSLLSFFGPAVLTTLLISLDPDSEGFNRGLISVLVISFHGPACSLIMLFSIRPYRSYVMKLLASLACRKMLKTTSVSSSAWT